MLQEQSPIFTSFFKKDAQRSWKNSEFRKYVLPVEQ